MANLRDIVDGLEIVEEFGRVKSARRVSLVEVAGTNYGDVWAAAANHPLVPRVGEALSAATPYVRAVYRRPRIYGYNQDTGKWKVRMETDYQFLRPLELTQGSIAGGGALTQIETQVDRDGNAIEVTYGGQTYKTPLSVFEPTQSCAFDVLEYVTNPDSVVSDWLNHRNAESWKGGQPRQWLCMVCTYRLVDELASPWGYLFHYEFEKRKGYDGKGWIYTAAYKSGDGYIPADATYANGGIVDVEWHPERDFKDKFPG